ncbi:hypothetical protein EV122DRAFT_225832, partial [Schizophyllum commune]
RYTARRVKVIKFKLPCLFQNGGDSRTLDPLLPNLLQSREYRDVLAALDKSLIPTEKPYTDRDWYNVSLALGSISALNEVLLVTNLPDAVHKRVSSDTIPLVWDWMLFFHPHAGNYDDTCLGFTQTLESGYKETKSATDRVNRILAIFFFIVPHDKYLAPLALAIPDFTVYMYDLWQAASRGVEDTEPASAMVHTLGQALADFCYTPEIRQRIASEILSRGPAHMRALVKRLRAITRMPEPDLEELSLYVDFIHSMVQVPIARPFLRDALYLIGPAMRLYEIPDKDTYYKADIADLYLKIPSCGSTFLYHCCNLASMLREDVQGFRDVLKFVRAGALRELYGYMRRIPVVRTAGTPEDTMHPAAHAVNRIIIPAMICPAIAKAVSKALERDQLPPQFPSGLPLQQYIDEVWKMLHGRLQEVRDLKKRIRDEEMGAHCSREGCLEDARLRRCSCGSAFYCSSDCQTADWPRHRAHCQPVYATSSSSANFTLVRESDLLFIRRYVAMKCAEEKKLPSQGTYDCLYYDTTGMGSADSEEQQDRRVDIPAKSFGHVWAKVGVGEVTTVLNLGKL